MPSLTPVRGIAALWVVLYHYSFQYFPNLHPEAYTHLVEKGYLAVDLFFMLSGFVMTHVYRGSFGRGTVGGYRDFLKARIARLYPLHLVVLVLFVATALGSRAMEYAATGSFEMIPLEGSRSLGALLANLFMLQGLDAGSLSWNYPAWSISLEFMAYLVFPFLLPWIWRLAPAAKTMLAGVLFAVLAWLDLAEWNDFNQWDGPQTLLRCLPEFLLGTLLYSAFRSGRAGVLAGDGMAIGLAAGIVVLLHAGATDVALVALLAALILALTVNTGRVAALLNGRALVWLGDVSYSLYLIHGLVQYATTTLLLQGLGIRDREELSGGWSLVLLAAMVILSLVLAGLSYRHVEVTGRRYLRRLMDVRRPHKDAGVFGPETPVSRPSTGEGA
ncbi:acyltransferase family protein [Azospirillum sp. ST 5-10]|uniref:acyltransferase family protein n=1 Tax=unclassified Azospirillum TaxID=2630922 RepID=UPI003F49FF8A